MPACKSSRHLWLAAFAIVAALSLCLTQSRVAYGQASINITTLRPFVTGIVPVVGNGAVGGIAIDAQGIVSRSSVDAMGKLADERRAALHMELSADISAASDLRKVSLRRLEQAIYAKRKADQSLDQEMLLLAGLQDVQFIFLHPEENDIIIAGRAEGWELDKAGYLVGAKSRRPVLQLEDLMTVLRGMDAARETGITCSIDPSADGLASLQDYFDSGPRMSERAMRRMEQLVGPQSVTLAGVPADSHFARVMVAADFLMKRIAMGLEKSPVRALPSYMQMLKSARVPIPKDSMPRWWLAPDYAAPVRDSAGLAYALPQSGVKVMTEDSYLLDDGTLQRTEDANPAAKDWADRFGEHYTEVSEKMPVFAQLRCLMDLAIVAAIARDPQTMSTIGYDFPLLTSDEALPVASYHVPQQIASQSSFIKKGNQYVISISGGVDLAPGEVLGSATLGEDVAKDRAAALPTANENWWWD